jgi:hypothetical protein
LNAWSKEEEKEKETEKEKRKITQIFKKKLCNFARLLNIYACCWEAPW